MSEESTAAEMIRRFRQSRPTSRAEREQQDSISGKNKQPWWIQNEIDNDGDSGMVGASSPEPKPQSRLDIKPSKPTSRADLLSSNPVRDRKSDGINTQRSADLMKPSGRPSSVSSQSRPLSAGHSSASRSSIPVRKPSLPPKFTAVPNKTNKEPASDRDDFTSREYEPPKRNEETTRGKGKYSMFDDDISPAPRTNRLNLDDMSSKAIGKLRDSLEVDDWIEREIKSLEKEMRQAKGQDTDKRPSIYSYNDTKAGLNKGKYNFDDDDDDLDLDIRGIKANDNNRYGSLPSRKSGENNQIDAPARSSNIFNVSRASFENNFLRGSSDTLGSIKGLLDLDLRFDNKISFKAKESKDAEKAKDKHDEEQPVTGDINDVNHDLETLLQKLKKDQELLPNPDQFDFISYTPPAIKGN